MKNAFKFNLSLSIFLVLILLSTSIYAASLPNKVLPFMSKGPDVVEVQKALNKTGAKLTVDGVYGNATKNAVLNFQKKYSSLTHDGIYGPATKAALEKALASGSSGGNTSPQVPTGKVAYLTFDDGPSTKVTPRILKTLNDNNIKATFFILGNMAEKNPSLVKQIKANGHSIGNHTYSHDYNYVYANMNNFLGEVDKTDRIFKNILGNNFNSKLFRFPGGSFESKKAPYRTAIKARGYNYYDWNALNGDSEGLNIPASKLMSRIKETTKGKKEVIILMHDASTKSTTADALPEIIKYLKGQGYTFKTLNQ